MSDPSIREGYVQKNIAEGLKAAGSNKNGSMSGFMGMGLGMQTGGNFMAAASQSNMQQMKQSEPVKMEPVTKNTWKCSCGAENVGKFCPECGAKKPENKTWICSCGNTNTGKFCSECGKERPDQSSWVCECGTVNTGKFCPECGKMRP